MKTSALYPEAIPELIEMLQQGKAVRLNYGPGNEETETRHIRAWIDDAWIVYRVWHGPNDRWSYNIARYYAFWVAYTNGYLSPAKVKSVAHGVSDD